jgi:DNA polymerase-1
MKYPDLKNEPILGFDIETYDPNLKKLGTGVFRDDGYVLGISLATKNGFNEYYNIGHTDIQPAEKQKNLKYLRDTFKNHVPKVGANIIYDIDWIENFLKIPVKGKILDVQIAEALIDENQGTYNLDYIAKKYLDYTKYTEEIYQFCKDNNLAGDARNWLFKMPASLVSKYGKIDAKLPIDILEKQNSILVKEELNHLFEMESELIRCLLLFRKTGAKVDHHKRELNAKQLQDQYEKIKFFLWDEFWENFNPNSGKQVAQALDRKGIEYPLTEKGNPNIDQYFFRKYEDQYSIVKMIHEYRKAHKTVNTFLMGSLERYVINELIHPNYHNTRVDDFGARSGRLSCSDPNLQQIPAEEEYGKLCREIFIPFEGCIWGKCDYSQIEYRIIAHYARGKGSEELRQTYIENPDTDYHQYIMDLTKLDRKKSKNLNFGVGYGMGARFMSQFFNWPLKYCYEILDVYHNKAPYIKATMQAVSSVAQRRGYIKTILNRRNRLLDKKKAYIMFARLIQGSAADLMKKAMLDNYKAGIFDVLHPHLTVHDELDVSIPVTDEGFEAFEEMKYIMETAIKLKVPVKVDAEIGTNWANVKGYTKHERNRIIKKDN